jgi:anti-sigma regulatory factor (Ser/Thr protein kinase)
MTMPQVSGFMSETVVKVCRIADAVVAQTVARGLAAEVGCSEKSGWEFAIAVSEAANNIVKHAGDGEIRMRIARNEPPILELEALDRGTGIDDIEAILSPDYAKEKAQSQSSSEDRRDMGLGLCAISRLMDDFEVTNRPQGGTAVRARKIVVGKRVGPQRPSQPSPVLASSSK